QPVRKDTDGEKHASYHAGNSQKKPLRGITAFEEQQVGCGENPQTRKSQQRCEQHRNHPDPVCASQRKMEKGRAPAEINGDAQRRGSEGINRGPCQNYRQRDLRDQQWLQCPRIPRFQEAAIETVQRRIEIVEKYESHQRVSKVRVSLRQRLAQLRRIHETRHIVKHRYAKQRFDRLQDKRAPVGAGDPEVALKKEKQIAKGAHHAGRASTSGGTGRPVSRKKTCSREDAPAFARSPAGVSSGISAPSCRMATRSARSSISGRECEAKRREVPCPARTSALRKRRKSDAAIASKLRVGSSSSRTLG